MDKLDVIYGHFKVNSWLKKLLSSITFVENNIYCLIVSLIVGSLFTLIESFLADRKQRVVLNGKCSK